MHMHAVPSIEWHACVQVPSNGTCYKSGQNGPQQSYRYASAPFLPELFGFGIFYVYLSDCIRRLRTLLPRRGDFGSRGVESDYHYDPETRLSNGDNTMCVPASIVEC